MYITSYNGSFKAHETNGSAIVKATGRSHTNVLLRRDGRRFGDDGVK